MGRIRIQTRKLNEEKKEEEHEARSSTRATAWSP